MVEDPVVVVAAAEGQLGISRGVHPFADGVGGGEIKRCTGHGGDFARGNEALFHGGIVGGMDGELVAVNVAVTSAAQVETGVIGQIHRRGRIGGRDVVHAQGIAVNGRIGHRHFQGAGVTLFASGAAVMQLQGLAIGGGQGFGLPQNFVEAHLATVEVTGHAAGFVVGGQGCGHTVEGEAALGNAVAVAADEAAEVGRAGAVALQVVKAEDHVTGLPTAIGNLEADHGAAVITDAHRHARVRVEGVQVDGAAIGQGAPVLLRGGLNGGTHDGEGAGQG